MESIENKQRSIAEVFGENLPRCDLYEKSFLHKELLTFVLSAPRKDLIFTFSDEGVIKFWKKQFHLIEYIKTFKAHIGSVTCARLTESQDRMFTTSPFDKTIKVFDLTTYDMISIVKLDVALVSFCPEMTNGDPSGQYIGIDKEGSLHRVGQESHILSGLSRIVEVFVVESHDMLITLNTEGYIEYLDAESMKFVQKDKNRVSFGSKFETDLFKFQKAKKGKPISMEFSASKSIFYILTSCLELWVFETATAKILIQLNITHQGLEAEINGLPAIDKQELSKRITLETDLLEKLKGDFKQKVRLDFDESETYLIIPTVFGIMYYCITTKSVYRFIATKEKNEGFIGTMVYQGKRMSSLKGEIGQGGVSSQSKESDPLIFSWAFKKPRFYIFSNRLPHINDGKGSTHFSRDMANEKADTAGQHHAVKALQSDPLPTKMIISTSLGDIYIRLYHEFAPRAVENFATHAKNKYYENCIFHRVVKGYVQTGDPLNDGSGGESIWKKDFEDEFSEEFKHDKPFTVSMANSGPNTNGSQFFITTMPSPWLDKKHTVFGRVYKGTDVVIEIESLKTDNFEKPLMDVRILRIKAI
jgi:peptidylprolyl isomerase domain and WD repeat-containing protein 1